jgi:hypothetical protein
VRLYFIFELLSSRISSAVRPAARGAARAALHRWLGGRERLPEPDRTVAGQPAVVSAGAGPAGGGIGRSSRAEHPAGRTGADVGARAARPQPCMAFTLAL